MAQMFKMKYSKNFKAIQSRLRRLPKLVNSAFETQIKKDAVAVIEEYKKGMRKNNFGLEKLSPVTIEQKENQGLPRPRAPLYGKGDLEKNSLINALSLRRIKNGWKIMRRRAKHYKADLPLNVLLAIHEHGAIIQVTDKMRAYLHWIGIHLKKDTTAIRLPPRPVYDKAVIRALKKKRAGEPARSVKNAINQLIQTGKDSEFRKLLMFKEKEVMEFGL